tara:strand:- start:801 stop:1364 length:564 start_codon:yes stop_codon:yes gene_type:complete
MLINCNCCGVEFDKSPTEVKRSKSGKHFCSRSCSAKVNNLGVKRHKPKPVKEPNLITKECLWHACGNEFQQEKKTRATNFCSRKCKNSYSVQKRRIKLKLMAVKYKGGKCERCGYDKCVDSFDFHHRDPKEKEFGIGGKGHTKSWDKIKKELDKCLLLCANCHREEHYNLKRTHYIIESISYDDLVV